MTATYHGIPVYDARVDSQDAGMLRISLVDDPAVCSDFVALAEQKQLLAFKVTDEDKRLVRGVVMRADFPIYRRTPQGYEYYIVYRKEVIREMAEKYLLEGRQNEVNLMHEEGSDVDGVQMVQYFIKDSAAGINPEGFEDITDGSLFAEFHVVNDEVWDAVKAGTYKGFSLEGYFDLVPEQLKKQTPKEYNQMAKMNTFKGALRRLLKEHFSEVSTDKGVLGWDTDEDLKAGDAVYVVNEDGSHSEAADGDYMTEDGKTVVVENGKVAEIHDPEAEVATDPEEFGEVSTDKGTLYHEGDEDLKEGDEVYTEDENGERKPAEDGEYRTEDGKTITVVDGRVASISDPEAEVAPERDAFRRIKAAFDESYDEKYRRIYDAIFARGFEDFYIVEAGDDFAVIEVWDEENYSGKLYLFPVSWDEEGNAIAGDPEEVKVAYVPVDAPDPAAAEEEMAKLRKEVATLKARSAAKPAHEEVRMHSASVETGIKGADNLARRLGK